MKKVILTVSALLVSAAMVFAFAGCTDNQTDDDGESNPAGIVSEADTNA